MPYRLSLDIGTNSIGWWLYELRKDEDGRYEAVRSIDGGVRIFPDGRDPQSKKSLAEDRRLARGMRRRRDRYIRRREALMRELIRAGLMPEDEQERKTLEVLDPYDLRRRALDEALTPFELGRALFHLNQRRGFKSNRKTDARNNEAGAIKTAAARLEQAMMETGARTFGEFLYQRKKAGLSTRARLRPETGENAKGSGYDFYPTRKLLEEEFEKIWQTQQQHHPGLLNDNLKDRLRYIIFGQRPLKPPRVGKCTFIPEETRLPKAHPLFQELRLYQEVNHLEIQQPGERTRKLTPEERDRLVLALQDKKQVSYKSLRKLLKLPEAARFNKERPNRDKMAGNEVRAALGHKKAFGPRWAAMSWQQQWQVIERLLNEQDPEALHAWLTDEQDLSDEQAEYVASLQLPKGYGRLGLTATRRILTELQEEVIPYNEAVERAGLGSHSDFATGEILDALPYYGCVLTQDIPPGTGDPNDEKDLRIGRITNPTVHIGLNQLRRLVNRIIERYGKPAEIVIELARELKMNDRQKSDYEKRLRENTKKAEERGRKLEELGIENNGRNRLMLSLWEELDEGPTGRICVYTGKPISIRMLFSGEVDIDHILPYSKTLDDSAANKTVCLTEANRFKRNRSPWEAWGGTDEWQAIAERARKLPPNKRWRFTPDAMERYQQQEGFLPRQLTETQYLARMARKYLAALYPVELSKAPVWVTNGKITEMLRRRWGLNDLLPDHNHYETGKAKNRQDHRHHAIDAAVIGLVDRKLMHNISTAAGRLEQEGLEDYVWQSVPSEPWEGFRGEMRDILQRMIVSHRPRHKKIDFSRRRIGRDQTAGKLHNETAYGLTGEVNDKGSPLVVHRVPLESLKKPADILKIRDEQLRNLLLEETHGLSGKEFQQALVAFSRKEQINGKPNPFRGLRRVRIIEPLNTIPIHDRRTGLPYKAYKGGSNYCYEVWRMPDGKWKAVVISMFDAHQGALQNPECLKPHPAAKRLMRIFQNDMCAWNKDGELIVGRVVKFTQNGQITLVPHNEANVDARNSNKADPFKFFSPAPGGLKKLKFRLLHVNEIGQLHDPGPLD